MGRRKNRNKQVEATCRDDLCSVARYAGISVASLALQALLVSRQLTYLGIVQRLRAAKTTGNSSCHCLNVCTLTTKCKPQNGLRVLEKSLSTHGVLVPVHLQHKPKSYQKANRMLGVGSMTPWRCRLNNKLFIVLLAKVFAQMPKCYLLSLLGDVAAKVKTPWLVADKLNSVLVQMLLARLYASEGEA